MRITIKICLGILSIATLSLLSSCSKEPAQETMTTLAVSKTEASVNERIYYIFTGSADFFAFYNGLDGRQWDIPESRGDIRFSPGDTIWVSYPADGTYKAIIVATSHGNWASETIIAIDSLTVTILDNETGIDRARMRRPVTKEGVIDDGKIYFTLPEGTELSNIQMRIFPKSNAAKVYPNSDESLAPDEPGGLFTADFSGSDPHILVESYRNTTQKYPIEFTFE